MLKRYYKEVKLAFIENKTAIYLSLLILIFSIILGYFLKPYLYSYFNPVVDDLTQKVQSGVVRLTFQDIFTNNVIIIFQMFVYGLLFCLSVLILAFNGFFLGYYIAVQDSLFRVLALIIPHAIFELSSCVLACASGIVLFNYLLNVFKSYLKEDLPLKDSLLDNFDKFKQAVLIFSLSLVLMIIAGIVEVYLTIPISSLIFTFLG